MRRGKGKEEHREILPNYQDWPMNHDHVSSPNADGLLSELDETLGHYRCVCYHRKVYIGTVETCKLLPGVSPPQPSLRALSLTTNPGMV
jgi:hypothetical protein